MSIVLNHYSDQLFSDVAEDGGGLITITDAEGSTYYAIAGKQESDEIMDEIIANANKQSDDFFKLHGIQNDH